MPVSQVLLLRQNRQVRAAEGRIGVGRVGDPELTGEPASVTLAVTSADREWVGELRVGEEFAVGSEIWRVLGVERDVSGELVGRVECVALAEQLESAEWEYYRINKSPAVAPERDDVVRVRRGELGAEGFSPGVSGQWVPTDEVERLAGRGEFGLVERITQARARELLTDWVREWRFRRLPPDLAPLGPLLVAEPWSFFLVGAEGGVDPADLAGSVLRHRTGASAAESFEAGPDGVWRASDLLQAWVDGVPPRSLTPVTQGVASWLVASWVERGRVAVMPQGLSASLVPGSRQASGGWVYFRSWMGFENQDRNPGSIVRWRLGTSLYEAWRLERSGEWSQSMSLFGPLVQGETERVVRPVTVEQVRALVTRWVGEGLQQAFPEDLEPWDGGQR